MCIRDRDYRELEDALLAYGQDKLGCSRMTPAWLSCYVDGCYQNFHADNPHGPWAFVLSLTRSADRFEGGATTIMKPSVLEYWRSYDSSKGCEFGDVFDTVAPQFNRLTVFDPRIPHGVSRVRGTQDPREGRLVLHGWYADPTPFFDGALDEDTVRRREREREREVSPRSSLLLLFSDDLSVLVPIPDDGRGQVQGALSECLEKIGEELQQMPPAIGMLSIRIKVLEDGSVESLDWLSDTLVPIPGAPVLALDGASVEPPEDARQLILEVIVENLAEVAFPKAEGATEITIPFLFQ